MLHSPTPTRLLRLLHFTMTTSTCRLNAYRDIREVLLDHRSLGRILLDIRLDCLDDLGLAGLNCRGNLRHRGRLGLFREFTEKRHIIMSYADLILFLFDLKVVCVPP